MVVDIICIIAILLVGLAGIAGIVFCTYLALKFLFCMLIAILSSQNEETIIENND